MHTYTLLVGDKNLKKIGDSIITTLTENGNLSKYRIIGNLILLDCTKKIKRKLIGKTEALESTISSSAKKEIYESIKSLIKSKKELGSFAVRVTRKGSHPYNSTNLARDVAGAVFEEWKEITVDLSNPELEIFVQIINNISVIYLKYA